MALFPETPGPEDLNTKPERVIVLKKIGDATAGKLTLINTTSNRTLLYKIKCTDNARFKIDECSGLIGPGEEMVVVISQEKPPKGDDKAKILIQHLLAPSSQGKPWVMWRQATAQEVQCKCRKLVLKSGQRSKGPGKKKKKKKEEEKAEESEEEEVDKTAEESGNESESANESGSGGGTQESGSGQEEE